MYSKSKAEEALAPRRRRDDAGFKMADHITIQWPGVAIRPDNLVPALKQALFLLLSTL